MAGKNMSGGGIVMTSENSGANGIFHNLCWIIRMFKVNQFSFGQNRGLEIRSCLSAC